MLKKWVLGTMTLKVYSYLAIFYCGLAIQPTIAFSQENGYESGPIQLRIKLVDETGAPTKGIYVIANIFTADGSWEGKRDLKTLQVDDFFSYDSKYCTSIELDIGSKDYRHKRVDFGYGKPYTVNPTQHLKILKTGVHLYEETVVLQKYGKIGKMHEYIENVSFNPESGYRVIGVSKLGKNGKMGESISLQNVKDPDQLTTIPRIYVRQIPRKDVIKIKPNEKPHRPLENDVCLVMDDRTTNCGFIKIDFKSAAEKNHIRYKAEENFAGDLDKFIDEHYRIIIRDLMFDMTEAPEIGYQKELKIPDGFWDHNYPICFYIKMNGLYGKGYINGPNFSPGTRGMSFDLRLIMELDGSRNVTAKIN